MKGKSILLGISGGIAAYKAAALCSKLTQAGADVHVVMTKSAIKMVGPATFQALSHHAVRVDTFAEAEPGVIAHIDSADRADLVVIAPATANILAKMAHGIADDMLSTVLLAATAPIFVAPTMNVHMYEHPATQENLEKLRKRGVLFLEPGVGPLACGYVGKGRMAEPEQIFATIETFFAQETAAEAADKPLSGRKVLVTAGGTVERLDPVRYFTNDSSGKMGFAAAVAARDLGAEVTLVAGRVSEPLPQGIDIIHVSSALEMYEAVLERYAHTDVVVKAAAVADYRPVDTFPQKMKKTENMLQVTLIKNPDILEELGKRKNGQFLVGFAAETEHLHEYAMDKLQRKNCDLIVVNDVSRADSGFGTDTNVITIFDQAGVVVELPLLSKYDAATSLMELVAKRLGRLGDV
ncbi:MAG: bifunctional phosphopantothenoylcysteine decarboxylase/phosphopantothenate--cysteine ligase CoaBC [Gorillibacterium sp.]|nr:bifunctional phosphopantothenoylcysteine decarboxylase/phosphopantothenate--cysteine ligase CoaBC [Gorillibacterium sp.]